MKTNENKTEMTQQEADFQLKTESKDQFEKKPNETQTTQAVIGYSFQNKMLFSEARNQSLNKKMAFFGDAVLDLIVSEFLFKNYEELDQGELTNLKSHLVCDEKLEKIVQKNEWDEYLIVEKGIFGKSKKMNSTFLEAVVGAIYLDGGMIPTEKFVYKFIVSKDEAEKEMKNLVSPKVRLYEFCQQHYGGFRPESFLISSDGPPHNKTFVMGYILPKEITNLKEDISGEGLGKTKTDAETKAAEKINCKLIQLGVMEK